MRAIVLRVLLLGAVGLASLGVATGFSAGRPGLPFAPSKSGAALPSPRPVDVSRTHSAPQRTYFKGGASAQLAVVGEPPRRILSMLATGSQALAFGDFRWNEQGVPAGRLWVRIDLSKQLISVFRGGHEIGASVIIFGSDGKPTPTGRFSIMDRRKDHVSNLYDADMPFSLRLTPDGVAIHASDVRQRRATHGCVGIPYDFAAKLFRAARVGDIVFILPANSA